MAMNGMEMAVTAVVKSLGIDKEKVLLDFENIKTAVNRFATNSDEVLKIVKDCHAILTILEQRSHPASAGETPLTDEEREESAKILAPTLVQDESKFVAGQSLSDIKAVQEKEASDLRELQKIRGY